MGFRTGEPQAAEDGLDSLYTLGRQIRETGKAAELDNIEREIDRVLQAQRLKAMAGDATAREVTALNVAAHRLENLIHDRRLALAPQQDGKSAA